MGISDIFRHPYDLIALYNFTLALNHDFLHDLNNISISASDTAKRKKRSKVRGKARRKAKAKAKAKATWML